MRGGKTADAEDKKGEDTYVSLYRAAKFFSIAALDQREYKERDSIFGIHKSLFWQPKKTRYYIPDIFGNRLFTLHP